MRFVFEQGLEAMGVVVLLLLGFFGGEVYSKKL